MACRGAQVQVQLQQLTDVALHSVQPSGHRGCAMGLRVLSALACSLCCCTRVGARAWGWG